MYKRQERLALITGASHWSPSSLVVLGIPKRRYASVRAAPGVRTISTSENHFAREIRESREFDGLRMFAHQDAGIRLFTLPRFAKSAWPTDLADLPRFAKSAWPTDLADALWARNGVERLLFDPTKRFLAIRISRFSGRVVFATIPARARRRVFGSADRSGADRTLDRAGAAQE